MLIDIKTNLKSLRFGNDRPGGGDSGQPFIQTPIPDQVPPISAVDDLYNLTAVGPTVPIQGLADTARIERFLNSPAGHLFTIRQQYLQLANPDIQAGKEVAIGGPVGLGLLGATRIYNSSNTLAQVSVQGSGFHFDRHGNTPVNSYRSTYDYTVTPTEGNDNPQRLVTLYNTKIANLQTGTTVQDANKLNISLDGRILLQYDGGPNSIGGIGQTVIPRFTNTDLNSTLGSGIGTVSLDNWSPTSLSYSQIAKAASLDPQSKYAYTQQITTTSPLLSKVPTVIDSTTLTPGETVGTINETNVWDAWDYNQIATLASKNTVHKVLKDFRLQFSGSVASTEGYDRDNIIDIAYNVGSPGSRPMNQRIDYTSDYVPGQDGINMLDILSSDQASKTDSEDLITFRFDTIEIESESTRNTDKGFIGAQGTTALIFRAFLTGLTDNHSAEYSSIKYVGRGDKFYAYDGFTRAISFNFKIAAQSRAEMRPLYKKLNYLVSQLYPDYQAFTRDNGSILGSGMMRSPLINVTIGDYISQQPGFLTSMNITVPDDSPWDINFEGADDMYQLPHVLDVSCQFTPIHNFLPRRSWVPKEIKTGQAQGEYANITPLITPNKGESGNRFGIGKNSQTNLQGALNPKK